MEKYLIVIDLDGTTLKGDKTIHPKTVEMIKEVCELGHIVVISTGRPYYSSYMYYHELGLNTLIVNRNGGHVHLPHSNDFDHSVHIMKDTIQRFIKSNCYQYFDHFYIEDCNDLYVIKGNSDLLNGRNYQFDNLYFHDSFKQATMFTIYVKNDHVNEVNAFFNQFDELVPVVWRHNGEYPNTMIEVFPKNVDKVDGIKHLCDYYQIPLSRTIAIGDEVNDIEMIKYVGIGVAMKNASHHLKEHADIILEHSNNEGGVGIFLEAFFQLNK